jgi:hypothetical protein
MVGEPVSTSWLRALKPTRSANLARTQSVETYALRSKGGLCCSTGIVPVVGNSFACYQRFMTKQWIWALGLLAIGCGEGGASGPGSWSKAKLDTTLEGSAGGQALTVKVPKNFVGEGSEFNYSLDNHVGDRTYTPHFSISVRDSAKTFAEATAKEKNVFEKEENSDGYFLSYENNGPTDVITQVVRNVGGKYINCQARVTRASKSETAESIKKRLPAARAICMTVELK